MVILAHDFPSHKLNIRLRSWHLTARPGVRKILPIVKPSSAPPRRPAAPAERPVNLVPLGLDSVCPGKQNPFDDVPPVDESTLVCKIGDRLVVTKRAATEEGDPIEVGSVYEVRSRIAYGWNLMLVSGSGAREVRALNSTLLSRFAPTSCTD